MTIDLAWARKVQRQTILIRPKPVPLLDRGFDEPNPDAMEMVFGRGKPQDLTERF